MAALGVHKKSLDSPDETRDFGQGKMQTATISDVKVARLLLQPGWNGSASYLNALSTERINRLWQ